MLLLMSVIGFFSLMSSIFLYGYATVCLSSISSTDGKLIVQFIYLL